MMSCRIRITLGVVIFVASVVAPSALAGNLQGRLRAPDSLILQGPGSDIRAFVVTLPEDRRPQGQAGVLVEQVLRGGPADSAGLRRGDIVTEFDGIAITDPAQFGKIVRDTAPRRSVKVIAWRDGSRREVFIAPVAARLQ
jgi:S1-C subfamily serine protease